MRKRQILATTVKLAFVGFLFYFCSQYFTRHWQPLRLSDRLEMLSVSWVLVAAVFTLAYYCLGLLIWTTILGNLGTKPNFYLIARAYVFSLLPKYIPGNFAAHGLRTQLASRANVPVWISLKSFVLEAVFALGTAAVISIPGTMYFIPTFLNDVSSWILALGVLVLIAVFASRRLKTAAVEGFRVTTPGRSKGYGNVVSLYFLLWLVSGAAHWCLANALTIRSVSYLPQLIVAVSASWAIGFVSIFAPAGLGVREAVLYFFVHNWMEQADVVLFVTLSRLLMFIAEVILTTGVLLYSKITQDGKCST